MRMTSFADGIRAGWKPYALVLAASSFLYIAVADLIPQMQRRLKLREAVSQVVLIGAGVFLISLIAGELHHHHLHGAAGV